MVTFSAYSMVADLVELCVLDGDVEVRHPMVFDTGTWSLELDVPPGSIYGFRVHGPFNPSQGLFCDPNVLLADPQARLMVPFDNPTGLMSAVAPISGFDWGDDAPVKVPWSSTLVYEAHVQGLTLHHPDVPEEIRGTYAALAHPALIEHLVSIGVTTLELLPVQAFASEKHLRDRGQENYWGYNTAGFFALHLPYASTSDPLAASEEFKGAIKALHQAGIEVVLDVVYNHTCEGGPSEAPFHLRGLDNPSFYRLLPGQPALYDDSTGCGNSLDLTKPAAFKMVLDSLRFWVQEYHVDGFRFDLSPTLARTPRGFETDSAFLLGLYADPVISGVKLFSESWDVGLGGYQVGNFPAQWSEWNGRFRDSVRDFWRGSLDGISELGFRLAGSSDLFADPGRTPRASVNFVTAHDGFTLTDLVSYNEKHNEANGEGNRDGESFNRSWNCGIEGPTTDHSVLSLRRRQRRNFLATLLLAQGVPMLSMGDELGRTQKGNNNAYCQPELAAVDWANADRDLLAFVRRLAVLASRPEFRHTRFLKGTSDIASLGDVAWLSTSGSLMTPAHWNDPSNRTLVMVLASQAPTVVILNAASTPVSVTLPPSLAASWQCELDTTSRDGAPKPAKSRFASQVLIREHSLMVLRAN